MKTKVVYLIKADIRLNSLGCTCKNFHFPTLFFTRETLISGGKGGSILAFDIIKTNRNF